MVSKLQPHNKLGHAALKLVFKRTDNAVLKFHHAVIELHHIGPKLT